jgi:branched-chain amino acid transport system permease protein
MGYEVTVLTVIAINILLAASLNLITGFCGQISLGHAAFFGIGAYAFALLAVKSVSFPIAMIAGGIVAGLVGLVVGLLSLRVRHDFLAITTMGVEFLFLGFVRKQEWLGAELGVSNIPASGLGDLSFMFLTVVLAAMSIGLCIHIKRSWMGLTFNAVADDEDTARTVGIDVMRYKLSAFGIGTFMAGIGGGLYASFTRIIVPDAFDFGTSIMILAMVVIGGIGSNWGVLVAAVILTLMPEIFRFVNDFKLLIFGSLLVVVMVFSPGGLSEIARSAWQKVFSR